MREVYFPILSCTADAVWRNWTTMYTIVTDIEKQLLTLDIYEQINRDGMMQLLEQVEEDRKKFPGAHNALVILHGDLVVLEETINRIDLTIYSGKLQKLEKAAIVYIADSKISRKTADRLKSFYRECGLPAYTTHDLIDAKKYLGLLW
jgi:hypothetical protein